LLGWFFGNKVSFICNARWLIRLLTNAAIAATTAAAVDIVGWI